MCEFLLAVFLNSSPPKEGGRGNYVTISNFLVVDRARCQCIANALSLTVCYLYMLQNSFYHRQTFVLALKITMSRSI